MHPVLRTIPHSLLFAFTITAPACTLTPEIIGETLTGLTSGEDDSLTGLEPGASTTTSADEPITTGGSETGASSTSAGPSSAAYGSFCELEGLGRDIQRTEIAPQPSCDGGICLVVKDIGPLACASDLECEEEAAGAVCGQGDLCNLSPEFLQDNARCTQACEVAEDCPEIPGCNTGVACTSFTFIGELCCQKVCACKDHLNLEAAEFNHKNCDLDPEFCSDQAP